MVVAFDIRPYEPGDYGQVAALYRRGDLYGGQFDENRDAPARLQAQQAGASESVLVAVGPEGAVLGTVSLIDDGRVAWLFRFAVDRTSLEDEVAKALYRTATAVLAKRGHRQVLVYTPSGDDHLHNRYEELGMTRGGDYTCYWNELRLPDGALSAPSR